MKRSPRLPGPVACLGLLAAALAPAPGAPAAEAPAAPSGAERVVLVVWDGLRPDLVSQTNTPNLSQLAREGVFFSRHHAVYPTSTEVNGSALATGDFPDHTTVLANKEYRPAVDPAAPVPTEDAETIRKAEAGGAPYLPVPTVAETVRALGFPTAVAGTKGVALLADRAERTDAASPVLFRGRTRPAALADRLAAALGPFPADLAFPNVAQDLWTTRALTEELWKDGVPKFSLLWLSDPDITQHRTAPGALPALSGLRSSDRNLGRVLDALEKKGVRAGTDVLVVSDHGFSTLSRTVDVAQLLQQHGFAATRRYAGAPRPGEILVDSLGGSVFCYVPNHDAATIRRLAEFFQQSDFAGVIFARGTPPGTFPLDAVRLDLPSAPDVAVSLRWTADVSRNGVPGLLVGDVGYAAGQGSHASLSRFDARNTLVAAGPDFKRGLVSTVPSGNIDVAPTILALLGAAVPPPMDGRVLAEALRVPPPDAPPLKVEEEKLSASAPAGTGTWSQYLVVEKVNGTAYFDEGNGGAVP